MISQLLLIGFAAGCQVAVFALAVWILNRSEGFIDVGLPGVFLVCGYGTLWLAPLLGIGGAFACAGILGGMASLALGLVVYEPLRSRVNSPAILLVSSIGAYVVLANLTALFGGGATAVVDASLSAPMVLGTVRITTFQLLAVISAATLLLSLRWVLWGTPIGLRWRAMTDDPMLSSVFGTNPHPLRIASFVVAGAATGIAAALATADSGINPTRGMPAFIDALAALMLGGRASVFGPLIGGLAIGFAKVLVIGTFSERWEPAVSLLILMGLLIWKPSGLLVAVGRTA